MTAPDTLLHALAAEIVEQCSAARTIVAVDGVDGSGKTRFADALAPWISRAGVGVVRASIDGFHNRREVRYERGRHSPEGFYQVSYNYAVFKTDLVAPFLAGASQVQTARFDHKTDQEVTTATVDVPSRCILLVDGIFLHRSELAHLWTYSIFLSVPFSETFARMVARDGTAANPDADSNRRYRRGQQIYLDACNPEAKANVVIDNTDFNAPGIIHRR